MPLLVSLDEEIAIDGSRPVLNEMQLQSRLDAVSAALAQ
jgi:hypothetical protein